jgi:hypothetical protein
MNRSRATAEGLGGEGRLPLTIEPDVGCEVLGLAAPVLKKSRMCSMGSPLSPSAAAASAPPPGYLGAPGVLPVSTSAACPTRPPPVAAVAADPPRKELLVAARWSVPRD